MAKLKIGDQVRLKSGGPVMTVKRVRKPSVLTSSFEDDENDAKLKYDCQWFAGAKLNEGIFPDGSLEAADGEGTQRSKRK